VKRIETTLPEVVLLEPKVFGDARGFFYESWNKKMLADVGLDLEFVQDNHSRSSRGVLRGLHYQIQQPQGKLVRAVVGEVFDVAVDMQRSSPNFGKWVGFVLSAENKRLAWIPPGFAHGFLVLSEFAEFLYKTTEYYAPAHERSLLWNDPTVGIEWPLDGLTPQLAAKDLAGKLLRDADSFS
jgi:dTDP-4-dehydrorhamnose 3,5-epimerase